MITDSDKTVTAFGIHLKTDDVHLLIGRTEGPVVSPSGRVREMPHFYALLIQTDSWRSEITTSPGEISTPAVPPTRRCHAVRQSARKTRSAVPQAPELFARKS